jgi:hypothetical protein
MSDAQPEGTSDPTSALDQVSEELTNWFDRNLSEPVDSTGLCKLAFLMAEYKLVKNGEESTEAAVDKEMAENADFPNEPECVNGLPNQVEAEKLIENCWKYSVKTSKGTEWEGKARQIRIDSEYTGIKNPSSSWSDLDESKTTPCEFFPDIRYLMGANSASAEQDEQDDDEPDKDIVL